MPEAEIGKGILAEDFTFQSPEVHVMARADFCQRFRKGVGGMGLATNKPPKEPKKFSRNASPYS